MCSMAADFVNLFGQSEICMFSLSSAQHRPDGTEQERKRLGSVGQALPNLLAKVVDEDGNECQPNQPGEIRSPRAARCSAVTGTTMPPPCRPCVMAGAIPVTWVASMRMVSCTWSIAKKDMIITGGENVYSREVEEALLQHAAVSECAVIGIPDAKWGESVCAVITFKQGESTSEDALIEHTRSLIASYKKPKKIIVVDALPKLVTGKVNKIELRKLYAQPN